MKLELVVANASCFLIFSDAFSSSMILKPAQSLVVRLAQLFCRDVEAYFFFAVVVLDARFQVNFGSK